MILQLHVTPAVLGLLDFVLRGIAFVNHVHDFVDFLFAKVFFLETWATGEKRIARVEEPAHVATGLQPVPHVLKEPPDAGPEEGDSAEVHQQGEYL